MKDDKSLPLETYQEVIKTSYKNMKKEILTPQKTDYDIKTPYERDVRPRKLTDYIGQEKVKDGLKYLSRCQR